MILVREEVNVPRGAREIFMILLYDRAFLVREYFIMTMY